MTSLRQGQHPVSGEFQIWSQSIEQEESILNLPKPTAGLRSILKSQVRASLAMFRDAVEQCRDDLWLDDGPPNAFWQIAYHTIFIGHAYLQTDFESWKPWAEHQADVQQPDGLRQPMAADNSLPMLPEPYTRAQVLKLCGICDDMVDSTVDRFDLESQACGFPWYMGISKLEHQLIAIRHIQHHTAQLADRLRAAQNVGVDWVGAR